MDSVLSESGILKEIYSITKFSDSKLNLFCFICLPPRSGVNIAHSDEIKANKTI